jgi:hypothetical protein
LLRVSRLPPGTEPTTRLMYIFQSFFQLRKLWNPMLSDVLASPILASDGVTFHLETLRRSRKSFRFFQEETLFVIGIVVVRHDSTSTLKIQSDIAKD